MWDGLPRLSGGAQLRSRSYSARLAARYVPNPIMMAPVAVRCVFRNLADERILFPSGPANIVTTRSADVFMVTEIVPSIRNCQNTYPLVRSTNCGMNDRKNSAVFGL